MLHDGWMDGWKDRQADGKSDIQRWVPHLKIMRDTLDAAFELNKHQILSKKEEASNRFREDTAPRNPGDRALCSNHRTVRGTLLQSILDY